MAFLSKEIKAYTGLKEYEKAVKLSTVFIALTDSIYQREKTNAALELETLYDVMREKPTLQNKL